MHGGTNRDPEKNSHYIHQRALGCVSQSSHHAALFHQITQHKHSHQWGNRRYQQSDDPGCHQREEKLLGS